MKVSFKEIRGKVKKPENFWFHVFYYCSSYIVWLAARWRISPNQLTLVSFALNTLAAVYCLFTPLNAAAALTTLALFCLAHIFDCADGHLAFVTSQRSECGYWLDSGLDIFKSAFVTACFLRLTTAGGVGVQGWAKSTGLCAALGIFVNYTVSLHAARYRQRVDSYGIRQIETTGIKALSNGAARLALSHVREYGNLLVVFGTFALNAKVGLCLLIFWGGAHYALALHRIYRVACWLKLQRDGSIASCAPSDDSTGIAQADAQL